MARRVTARHVVFLIQLCLLGGVAAAPARAQAVDTSRRSAQVWQGRNAEFEEFIRTAPFVRIEEVPIGVTKPKRAYFGPGGLVESVAWKVLPPSIQSGFWESYKSEIAAYELDKLLGLGMVPPVVEKRHNSQLGAAILWLSPVHPWREMEAKPKPRTWDRQAIDMKMFDDLIGNKDRNAGNFLIDDEWHLFLIDHSRAFISSKELPWPLVHVDRPLWKRMLALDEPALTTALGAWVGRGEIRAILARRDRMKAAIDALVKKHGEAAVFVD
jgi:hypothetical protein